MESTRRQKEQPGGWQKWQVVIAITLLVGNFGLQVFTAGGTNATLTEQVHQLQSEVKTIEADYARAKEVDVKLKSIEDTLKRVEDAEQSQSKQLEDFLLQVKPRK